jgi:hypothetical protein
MHDGEFVRVEISKGMLEGIVLEGMRVLLRGTK